jgi:hypothetical protein
MAPEQALPLIAREVHGLMKRLARENQKSKVGAA